MTMLHAGAQSAGVTDDWTPFSEKVKGDKSKDQKLANETKLHFQVHYIHINFTSS